MARRWDMMAMPELTPISVPEKTLTLFNGFIARAMGLSFGADRLHELKRKVIEISGLFGFEDPEACMLWLMSAPLSSEQLEVLAGSLTIGETYFFRDPRSFKVLEEQLLPDLLRERVESGEKRLRIWSAGCSSGEEPYSIAILLDRIIPDLEEWNIVLLASDINPGALERGRNGVYGRWSFRDPPHWLMEYFTKREDGRFQIVPRIRKMVRFTSINLAEDSYPSLSNNTNAMDIIFCRNVMLYFDRGAIERMTARFRLSLLDGGWLFVSPSEAPHGDFQGFTCRRFEGAFVYRQETRNNRENRLAPAEADHFATLCPTADPPDEPTYPVHSELLPAAEAEPVQEDGRHSPAGAIKSADEAVLDEEPLSLTDRIFREARELYEKGSYELAAARAREIAVSGEGNADVMELLAMAYANLGRFDEARDCCEAAIAADRLRARNHYLLAVILDEAGRLDEAVAALKRALYIDHDYIPAFIALGNLKLKGGKTREARRNFRNALDLLEGMDPCEPLPDVDGLTAGRLSDIIRSMESERSVNE